MLRLRFRLRAMRASGGDGNGNSFPLWWRAPHRANSGIGQVEAQQPDGIMGQQTEWGLLAQMHDEAATTGVPVLVVSTAPKLLDQAENQASRFGSLRYFGKPFDLTELLETMESMIGDMSRARR